MNFLVLRSCRSRCANRVSIGVFLFFAVLTGATADEVGVRHVTPESVIRYLQQDLFVTPGMGFRKVRIGSTFEQVMQAWGNPNKSSSSDIGAKKAWVYSVDRGSEISVSGSTKVESIEVSGSFNSPFSSIEGANFGMTPHQVISIYGKPADEGKLAKLRYPDRGIVFVFKSGALTSMRVFPPDS